MTFPGGAAAFHGLPGAVRAAFWLIAAGTLFLLMMALSRLVTDELHVLLVVFWRAAFGLVAMAPWLARRGRAALATRKLRYHALRTALSYAGLLCTFYAVTMLPIADITAITFIRPVVATLLAIAILGEKSRTRRWIAIAVGIVGATIIIRPGFQELNPGVFLVFGLVLVGATHAILARYIVRYDSPDAVAMYMVLFLLAFSAGPAVAVWQWPNLDQLPYLVAIGFFGTFSQRCLARAFHAADASVVVSFDYLRLPIAAAIGFLFFAEIPDIWVWAGGGVICVSSILLARGESAAERAGGGSAR
ncbi:MAG: DMT family transporter [Defluviicoccus sp.]|nr:DMT family transporter [Defluviicoccus sp.]MDE0386510.1 DMT family transporter [Defluviicoccus sp.]